MPTFPRILAASAAFTLVTATAPGAWCAREAPEAWADDPALIDALAAGVGSRLEAGVAEGDFATGSARFDGEWAFGSHLMGAIAFGQLAAREPARRADHLAAMERALDALLRPETRAYDTAAWGEDALEGLGGPNAHLAWVGYVAVPLGMHRALVPESRYAPLHDAIGAHLRAHLDGRPAGLAETYPGERYPVDNAVAMAGLAWHARSTGASAPDLAAWSAGFRGFIEASSGLLVQAVSADGRPIDAPRGSGTLFAAWFLASVDPALSRELWEGARETLHGTIGGFGSFREYPRGMRGWGDIDSGPVVFGQGVSATGFAMGVARAHGDEAVFHGLFATASLVGAPWTGPAGRRWVAGGPIGDAILLAMLTTPKGEEG